MRGMRKRSRGRRSCPRTNRCSSTSCTGSASASLDAFLDGGAGLAIGLATLDRLALVVRLLAASEREIDLDAAVLQVHPRRHQRQALLHGATDQLADLGAIEQELAPAQRFVFGVAAMAVG